MFIYKHEMIFCPACNQHYATAARDVMEGEVLQADMLWPYQQQTFLQGAQIPNCKCGHEMNWWDWVIPRPSSDSGNTRSQICHCDLWSVLMVTGCKCGGI